MKKLDDHRLNKRLLKMLKKGHDHDTAMEVAVGGNFETVGPLEIALLKHCGLGPADYLIDAGCGSGRLAIPLSKEHEGKYLGIDIMPKLLKHATKNVSRPDWRFEVSDGLSIPESDGAADMVCFFSVFTHILHENTFIYLRETKRVLKPKGKVVFSFLEFAEEGHWHIFEDTIVNVNRDVPLNVYLSRDALHKFAEKLDFTIEGIRSGSEPFIPMDSEDLLPFGQSVAVFVKK